MKCPQDVVSEGSWDHHAVRVEDDAMVLTEVVAKPVLGPDQCGYICKCLGETMIGDVDELEHLWVTGGSRTHLVPGDRLAEVNGGLSADRWL